MVEDNVVARWVPIVVAQARLYVLTIVRFFTRPSSLREAGVKNGESMPPFRFLIGTLAIFQILDLIIGSQTSISAGFELPAALSAVQRALATIPGADTILLVIGVQFYA